MPWPVTTTVPLAREGRVAVETLAILERLLATGRKLILVTGRELEDLQGTFPKLEMFHRVVAENGALLYDPAARAGKSVGPAPARGIREGLAEAGSPGPVR